MGGILNGCHAVITGATGGLGSALARAFWAAGASVLLTARDAARLQELADSLAPSERQTKSVHATDLAAPGAAVALAAHVERNFPSISVLVNNAAVLGPVGPAWENDRDDWAKAFHMNFFVPVQLCQILVPLLANAKGASIINISGGGATSPRANFTSYGAAKAALARFTETLAIEAAPLGIRVNSIAPGIMRTRMLEALVQHGAERSGTGEFSKAREVLEQGGTPPEAPARLAVLLASEESQGITGRLISAAWDPWLDLPHHAADLRDSDIYTLRRILPADRGLNWSK